MIRRAWLRGAAGLGATLVTGCKRQRAPKVEEVWDEAPSVEMTDALSALAPPWRAPTRAVLESGLAIFWLAEAATPVFHLRLLLPIVDHNAEGPTLAAATVAIEHLRRRLQRRLASLGVGVEVSHGPNRFEIAIVGRSDDLAAVLSSAAVTFGPKTSGAALQKTRDRLADGAATPRHGDVAMAALAASLLARPIATQRMLPRQLQTLSPEALQEAWTTICDPRRAVLIVHASDAVAAHRDTLRALSDRWHGLGRRRLAASAVARLRPAATPPARSTRLLATPAAPIEVIVSASNGAPVLVLGRVIPTASASEQSLARLSQRIAAEEVDARLVTAGPRSIFAVHVPLSARDPDGLATKAVDGLSLLAQTRQPQQRLFAAAELWLGARVVQASLGGEDWTALWSEAMDLAPDDASIATALGKEAATMLAPDADSFKAWQARWLDPRAGEGGWQWHVAGANDAMLGRLARIAPIVKT